MLRRSSAAPPAGARPPTGADPADAAGRLQRRAARLRRRLLAAAGLAATAIAVFFALPIALSWLLHRPGIVPPAPVSAQAQSLHAKLALVDLHADTLLWSRDLVRRAAVGDVVLGHVDLPRLTDGNVALQVFSVVTQAPRGLRATGNGEAFDLIAPLAIAQRWPPATWFDPYARAQYQAAQLQRAIDAAPRALIPIRTKSDIERLLLAREQAQSRGLARPIGAMLALEGAQALGADPGRIEPLFDAGFRVLGLVHFTDNAFAGSAHGLGGGGLTPAGRELLLRAQARGMVVDLAHASEQTIRDVAQVSTVPILVSHTGVKGTCDSPRNLSDASLRMVAGTGGLVGIGFWKEAVCGVSIDAIVRAIRHAVSVVGVEHVALGSDFDGAVETPIDAAGLAHLTQALTAVGFSDDEIGLIAGRNALRLMRRVLPD